MSGIYHGLFIAGFNPRGKLVRIDFVPSHVLQAAPDGFEPRRPLSPSAKRAGWQGFIYNPDESPEDRHPAGLSRLVADEHDPVM